MPYNLRRQQHGLRSSIHSKKSRRSGRLATTSEWVQTICWVVGGRGQTSCGGRDSLVVEEGGGAFAVVCCGRTIGVLWRERFVGRGGGRRGMRGRMLWKDHRRPVAGEIRWSRRETGSSRRETGSSVDEDRRRHCGTIEFESCITKQVSLSAADRSKITSAQHQIAIGLWYGEQSNTTRFAFINRTSRENNIRSSS